VDHRHNEHRHEAMGFWGFFETENDPAVSRALFGRAAADLRERGMTEMQGPMNPSVNNQCGLLVDGFDHPPAILMPYNPPYYPAFAEQAGLEPLEDLYAYFIDPERLARDPKRTQRLERLATSIRRRHPELTVRSIDLAHFEVDIRALGSLMERALNELPGHVPMPEEEMLFMTRDMKSIVDPGLVLLADVAGRPVGCAFGLPDINPILKRVNGRLFPFGWGALPAYRHMGVMPLLMAHLIRNARDRGYTKAELSWIRETNTRSFGTLEHAVAPRLYKRYRLYTSDL
jgi:GNAT superfamily N-acetyltransferase